MQYLPFMFLFAAPPPCDVAARVTIVPLLNCPSIASLGMSCSSHLQYGHSKSCHFVARTLSLVSARGPVQILCLQRDSFAFRTMKTAAGGFAGTGYKRKDKLSLSNSHLYVCAFTYITVFSFLPCVHRRKCSCVLICVPCSTLQSELFPLFLFPSDVASCLRFFCDDLVASVFGRSVFIFHRFDLSDSLLSCLSCSSSLFHDSCCLKVFSKSLVLFVINCLFGTLEPSFF